MGSYKEFGFLPPPGIAETHTMIKRNDEESGEALLWYYQLEVYMRDAKGDWYSLTSTKDRGMPSFDRHNLSADVLVTSYEGTWPGLCVWVRSHVPLWVVSRDLVGSVQ
eukprot:GHVU01119910.1.p1 GENE.GHVU01119910.1~~GHVU01119910.1.p1  ORF type:complete len:108 (-),score=5.66 GHVU01119910.1:178-501(-)